MTTTPSQAADTEPASDDEPDSALVTARRQLERAAAHIDVDDGVVERLKHPTRVQQVSVPLERDDGSVTAQTDRLTLYTDRYVSPLY